MIDQSKQLIVKTGMVSTPVIVAGVLVAVQFMLLGLAGDIISSIGIFGAGYATHWLQKKKAG